MIRGIRSFIPLFVIVSLIAWAGTAYALSVIETNITVDWSTLTIKKVDGTNVNPFTTFQGTYLRADSKLNDLENIGTPYIDNDGPWPTSPLYVSNSNSYAEGKAGINGALLSVSANASTDGVSSITAGATGDQHRIAQLYVTEDITLDFAIDYLINATSSTTLPGEGNTAYSRVAFWVSHPADTNHPANNSSGSNPPVWDVFTDALVQGAGQSTGTLQFSANLLGGNYYGLEVHLYSSLEAHSPQQQQVPEPSIIALLGLGLIGLAGVGRKFKK